MQRREKYDKDWKANLQDLFRKPWCIVLVSVIAFVFCVGVGASLSGKMFHKGEALSKDAGITPEPPAADDTAYDASKDALHVDQFDGVILPETKDAGQDYVDETLFVGDSNTARYMNYGMITLENGIGVIGMNVGHITSLPSVKFKKNGDMVTIDKAIPLMQPKRVVFAFGTNDLSGDVKTFTETYEKAIKKCYKAYPYFDIIVSAIPPVDRYRDYNYISMQNVDKFNAALVEMCEKNDWKFLNTTEVLKDEKTGFAKKDYTIQDGLHLSKNGVTEVFDYVRTHAWETEDRRPKPLKSVPDRGETPANIILKDPPKFDGPRPTSTPNASEATILFQAGEGGYLEGEKEQRVANGGTCATVRAVAQDGYTFSHWSCSVGSLDAGKETLNFTIPGNAAEYGSITVVAHFERVAATATPSATPTAIPTVKPTAQPTAKPTAAPTAKPTEAPVVTATPAPTATPTAAPTATPTAAPTATPTPVTTPEPVITAEPPQPEPPVEPETPAEPEVPADAPDEVQG